MSTVPDSKSLTTDPLVAPEPTWAVAHLFPSQGEWSENDFYALHGNRMIELVDGNLEVLPMPNWLHQLIVKFLIRKIETAIKGSGEVLDAPLPIRLFDRNIREPDVMYFAPGSEPKDPRGYPTRVDLAMEVVSEGAEAHRRDYEDKRRDYARAGILSTGSSIPSRHASPCSFLNKTPIAFTANFDQVKSQSVICCPHSPSTLPK